jgi:hypothetical protein
LGIAARNRGPIDRLRHGISAHRFADIGWFMETAAAKQIDVLNPNLGDLLGWHIALIAMTSKLITGGAGYQVIV